MTLFNKIMQGIRGTKRENAALGYHELGKFYYFSIFSENHDFLGSNIDLKEKFDSEEKFASLVTAIHEHYHLMQELQHGFNWWQQISEEEVLAQVLEYSTLSKMKTSISEIQFPLWQDAQLCSPIFQGDITDPLLNAKQAAFQLHHFKKSYTSNTITRKSIDWEIEANPHFKSRINQDLYDLTVDDLTECHAAILTEIFISKMIEESPEKFDERITEKLSPLFRINAMPDEYGKPLRGFLHLLNSCGMQFHFPKEADPHPFYKQIENGELYILLSFLLDFSLHIPPNPLTLYSDVQDLGTLQDIHPPLRFLSLSILLLAEVHNNKNGKQNRLLNEKLLYSETSVILTDLVNKMHNNVNPGRPRTFFSIKETTQMWSDLFKDAPLQKMFPELSTLRSNCISQRIFDIAPWFDLLEFDLKIGLPRVVVTNKGLKPMQYFKDESKYLSKLSSSERNKFLKKAATANISHWSKGKLKAEDEKIPSTMIPFRFVKEQLSHTMLCRFSLALLIEGKMRCPLSESIGKYLPCKLRASSCELIENFDMLPQEACSLRENIEQKFGNVNRYKKV